jgi:hypothetical protein
MQVWPAPQSTSALHSFWARHSFATQLPPIVQSVVCEQWVRGMCEPSLEQATKLAKMKQIL